MTIATLPRPHPEASRLFQLLFRQAETSIVFHAIRLKVFDHLDIATSAQVLSQRIGSHPGNTTALLDALAAMRLLHKSAGLYLNTPLAAACLSTTTETSMARLFTEIYEDQHDALEQIGARVLGGPGECAAGEHMNDAAYCEQFTEAHAQSGINGMAQLVARQVADLPELPQARRFLDLGCGPGLSSIALADLKDWQGVMFDRAEVLHIARRYVAKYGKAAVLALQPGDYLSDALGHGFDVAVACDTLYYPLPQTTEVLGKIAAALNPGGVFVSVHACLSAEGTHPPEAAIGLLADTMSGNAWLPPRGFHAQAMHLAGFRHTHSYPIQAPAGEFEVSIGRLQP